MSNLQVGSIVSDKNNETAEVKSIVVQMRVGKFEQTTSYKSLVILTFLNHSTFTSFQASLEAVEAYFNTGMWELK